MCRALLPITVFVLAIAVPACSGRKIDVTGKIRYNGAPLNKPGGQVVFVGASGAQVVGAIDADGNYRAKGVPAGLNRVAVYYRHPDFKPGKRLPNNGSPANVPRVAPFLTPEKYANVDTSGLSVNVDTGTIFNADLTGPEIP